MADKLSHDRVKNLLKIKVDFYLKISLMLHFKEFSKVSSAQEVLNDYNDDHGNYSPSLIDKLLIHIHVIHSKFNRI